MRARYLVGVRQPLEQGHVCGGLRGVVQAGQVSGDDAGPCGLQVRAVGQQLHRGGDVLLLRVGD